MSVYIIAEAGAGHGGNFQTAYELAGAAARAGADCVKFQIWKTEKFICPSSVQYGAFKKLEMSCEEWAKLKALCDAAGLDFLASAWDPESVDFLDSLDVKAFKVGSGDLTHEPLLKHIAKKGRPVYLSTGMATADEIKDALLALWPVPVKLLKCTVDYPCAEDDVNLMGLETLILDYEEAGFSDHTKGHLAACMAVAMGASVIEKHFALEETEDAIGAHQFAEWVRQVRQAERIMGSADLKTFPCEERWKPIARRGESGLRE